MGDVFSFEYFFSVFPEILSHLDVTLQLSLIATLFSLIIGAVLACINYYRVKILYQISRVYISFMRSTPLVALLYLFYYGLARVSGAIQNMDAIVATAIVLSLYTGAFMAETIRGAMLSVDIGQLEAADSLGMSQVKIVTRIVLPQAVRVALPPLFNDFINLVKLAALAFMLGVSDVMGAARSEGMRSFRFLEVYVIVVIIYWALISLFGVFHKMLEKKCENAY